MKFGQVNNPETIDFSLAKTAAEAFAILEREKNQDPFEVYIGAPSWSKQDLKGLYPKGTKDELRYYSQQFNAIELNATFYKSPSKEQVLKWKDKTAADFKFFPKITQSISHYSRLLGTEEKVLSFVDAVVFFEEKLGMIFLQLHDQFKPKDINRLEAFFKTIPKGLPFAVEVRNEEWFASAKISEELYKLLEKYEITAIITDTAGRRDLLHMRLTTAKSFIRFVATNHPIDYERLEEWISVIKSWRLAGLQQLNFFIHQDIQIDTPLLLTYFIKRMNQEFNLQVRYPQQTTLF